MAIAIVAVSLAGCTVKMPALPSGAGVPSPAGQRTIGLEVLSAKVIPGRCFDGATAFGEVCHSLDVRVNNTGFTNELSTSTLYWHATDVDGAGHDFGESSADSVAAGRTVTIHVKFTVPDGSPHLAEVKYSSSQGHGSAVVPDY